MGMFDNNNGMMMGGYQYGGYAPQQVPKVQNVLTAEEVKELQAKQQQFSLALTQREVLQAACNHRLADGTSDSLTYDPVTGIARCIICDYEFRPLAEDESKETIKDDCARIVDILQTIKMLYVDIPADAAREYFQIIPLINKIPQLYEYAAKNFSKHDFNMWNFNNYNMSGISMLQNFNNMFSGFGAAPQQPQQAPFNPYAQPGMPVGMPSAQPNPFGYQGAPQQPMMGGYQPQTAGYQYTPQAAPQQPAATPAPAPATTDTVTQAVSV